MGALEAVQPRQGLVQRFAERFGVDASKMLATLKQTCFRIPPGKDGEIREASNEELMALLVVSDQYGLNPFTKEIYAFPDSQRAGIVPVVSVDGWTRIINQHPAMNGIEFRYSDNLVQIDKHHKSAPEWCEVVIYRRDRQNPIVIREYLDEVYRPPYEAKSRNGTPYVKSGPWQTHTKRFLRHKALIQGARVAFGFAGIYDEDEAERIEEAQVIEGSAREAKTEDLMPRAVEKKTDGVVLDVKLMAAEKVEVEAKEQAEPEQKAKPEPQPETKAGPEPQASGNEPPPKVNVGMLGFLRKKLEVKGKSEADLCAAFKIEQLEDLPAASINEAIKWTST